MRQLKRLEASMAVSAVAVASAAMLGTGTASADGAITPLSNVVRRCDHSNDTHTRPGGDGQGFAVIGRSGNTVRADVTLQGASPDTQFMVRLIQAPKSPNDTCSAGSAGTVVAPMFGDAGGNAYLTLQGPVTSGATGAWVFIEGPMNYRMPFGEYYSTDFIAPI